MTSNVASEDKAARMAGSSGQSGDLARPAGVIRLVRRRRSEPGKGLGAMPSVTARTEV